MALNDKHKRFSEEYVIDLNATQAAIRAGYSEKTAYSQGQRLLKNVEIQNYISELKKNISKRNKISVDECISILANLARFDIAEIYDSQGNLKPLDQIPKEHRMAIEGLDTEEINIEGQNIGQIRKARLGGRKGAIDMLLKHLGGYEKHNDQKTSNVIIQLPDNGRG